MLDERDKHGGRGSKKGMTWGDRIVGVVLLYLLHAFVPTPEHGLINGLVSDFKVAEARAESTQETVKDHEVRIRSIERQLPSPTR